MAAKITATVFGGLLVKVVLPGDARVRLVDGFEQVQQLRVGSELAGPGRGRRILSTNRCPPPAKCVVFDAGSLSPNGPEAKMRVAPDTLVGFQMLGGQRQLAAAAGLVDGFNIRLEDWPRRLAAFAVEIDSEIAMNGSWIAALGTADLCSGSVWGGTSIARWLHRPRHQDEFERQEQSPVRVMSDGHWAELLSSTQSSDDIIMHFRIARRAHWMRVISPALVSPGQTGDEVEQRRFGIAIIALSLGEREIGLDSTALASGFYPVEGDTPRNWRWTDGNGLILLDPTPTEQVFLIRFTNWHKMLKL